MSLLGRQSDIEFRALSCGIAAVLLWSTVATGFKLGLEHLHPTQLLWIGCVLSLVLFSVFVWWAPTDALNRKSASIAACLGLINPWIYYLVLFEAYDRLPAHVAQPLNYLWAIAIAILAVPILKQRLPAVAACGIAVSYLGAVVLVTKGNFATLHEFDPVGVALALGSTLLWALYWLFATRQKLHSYWFLWIGFVSATPLVSLYCALTVGLPPLNLPTLLFGLWVGWVEMGFAFILWHYALNHTNHAGVLSQLIFISPLISLGLIYVVLGEAIHYTALIGMILIFVGIAVVRQYATPTA